MMSVEHIKTTHRRIAPSLHRTPLWHSRTLSRLLRREVHLKVEMFQKTGSFKSRAMLGRLYALTEAQRRAGVVTSTFSAVNSARGLGYAASVLGVKSVVVLPVHASAAKVEAVRGYGSEVVLHGTTAGECREMCATLALERGLTVVAAHDAEGVAGVASLGIEIAQDLPAVDAVLVGVGVGGLAAGVALGLRAEGSRARVIGVEPEGAPTMSRSLAAGTPIVLSAVATIAEGLATWFVGDYPYSVVKECAVRILLVSDEDIARAMRLLMERCKVVVEPAGAAGVAALLSGRSEVPEGMRVVCVLSGGNVDLTTLKALL